MLWNTPIFLLVPLFLSAQGWETLQTGGTCTARSESALAHVNNKLYLLGSRGIRPVNVLDLKTKNWAAMPAPPVELHHFQAVVYKGEIWVAGAFTGNYPHELPVDHIYIYNPEDNAWRKGPAFPKDRLRGSAGVTVYKNKIYILGGTQDGHWDGHTGWLDEYDPAKNTWTRLADAPHARDHVCIEVIDHKIYVVGGRRTTARTNNVINLKEAAVDVYDFKSGTWTTLPESSNLPTLRAGSPVIAHGHRLYVMGGESDTQVPAHSEVEVLDTKTRKWTSSAKLNQGRHSTGAVRVKKKIYIAGGAGNRGGGPELNSVEMLELISGVN